MEACNFTKSDTSPWVFFTFLKLYSWYQIVQNITNRSSLSKVDKPYLRNVCLT